MNAPERTAAFLLDEDLDERKITYAPDTKVPNAGTFTLNKEDHTLGNLIRMQLLSDPNVHFVGYMMPHPLINRLEMKIQTTSGNVNPREVLLAAVEDLSNETAHLTEGFKRELAEFEERKQREGAGDV